MGIEFGQQYRDHVTGFVGTCTGRAEFISGCNQALLVPQMKEGDVEMPKGTWIDEDRLTDVTTGERVDTKATVGGPADVPARDH